MLAKLVVLVLSKIVILYRYLISPLKPNCCRYIPSCSEYALDAWQKHGIAYGSFLVIRRVMRCHPWGGSGYDPVPEKKRNAQQANQHAKYGKL